MFSSKDFSKIFIIFCSITSFSNTNALPATVQDSKPSQISWIQQMSVLPQLIKECEKTNLSPSAVSSTWQCFKMISLNLIDDLTRRRIISLWPGMWLVQMSDVQRNQDSVSPNQNDFWQRTDLQYLTWFDRLALCFNKMLTTHMLQINLREITENMENMRKIDISLSNSTDKVGKARYRRHRFNMMVTMMFGATALGAVLVPMGFQMLSIVSGKALLLAKMALLLASINGLKKVASSGVHYGLYHVPGDNYGHYYDRGDVHHPRNIQNLTPIIQPNEMIVEY